MGDERGRAFTVASARRAGIGEGRLRNARFARPFHGVRVDGPFDPTDLLARLRALHARMGPHEFFSHTSAAMLHGIPLPRRLQHAGADVDVAVFAPRRAPQLRGVRSHEIAFTGQVVVGVHGLRSLGPADAWAQLGSTLDPTELVIAADWLLTGDEPYSGSAPPCSLNVLDAAISRRGRMRGVARLRAARDRARYGALSPQESRLRLILAEAGLPEPALNHRIFSDGGALVAMVDLAYPEQRVAIEYLGDHHRTNRNVFRDDILRRERLDDHGWSALYTTAADIENPGFLILRLRRLLASTGKSR